MLMTFDLQGSGGKVEQVSIDVKGSVICGYTGRDQEAVRHHIEELEREGVAPPDSVPAYFPKPAEGILVDSSFVTEGRETSGEVEFALYPTADALYVGVGSDHTDRELERLDVLKSKQICPTVVSRTVWNYGEIRDHWDEIEMRSWAVNGDKKILYQEAAAGLLMRPEELVERVRGKISSPVEGICILSGTPPLKTEKFVYADRFEAEIVDPVLMRKITLAYDVQNLEWFNF